MKINRELPDTRHVADLADKVKQLKGDYVTTKDDGGLNKFVKFMNRVVHPSKYDQLKQDSKELGVYLVDAYKLEGLKSLPEREVELVQYLEKMIKTISFPQSTDAFLPPVKQADDTENGHVLDTHDGTPASRLSSTVSVSSEDSLPVSHGPLIPSPQDSPVVPTEQPSIEGSDGLLHEDPSPPAERTGPLIAHSTSSVDDVATYIDRAQRILKELNALYTTKISSKPARTTILRFSVQNISRLWNPLTYSLRSLEPI